MTPMTQASDKPSPDKQLPGTQAGAVLEKVRKGFQPLTDRVFEPAAQVAAAQTRQRRSYELEADELLRETKLPGAGRLVRAALVVVVLLLVWAAFAQVDEVTRGEGKVIPSRQLQVVQSLDGGVVSEILVREGQEVERASGADTGPELDPTHYDAQGEDDGGGAEAEHGGVGEPAQRHRVLEEHVIPAEG